MTTYVAKASLRNPQGSTLQCLKCDCSSNLCYVVMKKKSIQKSASSLASTVVCPVHDGRSASKWARTFCTNVETIAASTRIDGIVWDWHDVPGCGNHHMHIDACVFSGAHCARFEIDGEAHFQVKETTRNWRDTMKDDLFRDLGVGLLHLHWRDVGDWEQFIMGALTCHSTAVSYTPSYRGCLEVHESIDDS
jgi:hypothetical protein